MTTRHLVRLRPVEADDLPRVYDLQLDPESNRLAATIPRTREGFDAHWAKVLADPGVAARAILAGEAMVGVVSCFPRDGQDHVGYWIDRAYWGMGIASRALRLLLEEVAKRPLVATAATSNGASLRVLQKCGFVVEQVRLSPASDRYPESEVAVHVYGRPSPGRGRILGGATCIKPAPAGFAGPKELLSGRCGVVEFRLSRDWYIGCAQPSQGCERGSTPLSRS